MTASPLSADRRPLSEQVADALMSRILEENLQPGDQLPTEPELIESFGVSRTVIREAGRTLIARGVVSIRPRRGMQVAEFDERNLSRQVALMLRLGGGTFAQLMEMRAALEPDMAAAAALRRSDAEVAELQHLVDLIAVTEGVDFDREAHIANDLEFHSVIARSTGNPFFRHLILPFNEILTATYLQSPGYAPERSKTHEEHARIAEAIASGDADLARSLSIVHVNRVSAAAETLTPHIRFKDAQ
ncbi:FadR/GntR family transcriptional regulator [Leucobacter luti]|uniref:GntR family transcriptional regulator n=1 Tax=Leucobacter luti TaxID=340320 RepID=A0A4Q7U0H9_9MICO|nr:FadR/GntR family transcriptional regulator [Leucobacter luti]MBL3699364.1 FadR family transcriptional regulator [Leucobacter luti]RZT66874.1 GntR family transcriptional regulator [Leucobacter luti]